MHTKSKKEKTNSNTERKREERVRKRERQKGENLRAERARVCVVGVYKTHIENTRGERERESVCV